MKFGGFDVYHKRIDLLTNSRQTSSEMIGIGGTLLQGHFEAIMRGGLLLRVGEPNRLITTNYPPHKRTPQRRSCIYGGGVEGLFLPGRDPRGRDPGRDSRQTIKT